MEQELPGCRCTQGIPGGVLRSPDAIRADIDRNREAYADAVEEKAMVLRRSPGSFRMSELPTLRRPTDLDIALVALEHELTLSIKRTRRWV